MIRSLYRRLSSVLTRTLSKTIIRRPALITILALTLLAVGIFVVQAADQFFAGDGSALTASKWGASAAGPFTSAFTTGNVANFATVNGTGTGGSITVGGITATENFTLTAISGTISNQSNAVIPINVSAGKTLDFSTQSFTSSATAGYNFTGPGVLALAGNTYGGGFTINSGTLVARGVNAMGGNATPGGLTINGGTIAGSATRDFSGKYSGITVGGNFQLGELTTNVASSSSAANLTFNANTALGAATRTITIGANGTYTLGGIITGNSGVGLTVANGAGANGKLVLSGVNTYSGDTTISTGTLALSGSGSIANSPSIVIAGGATFDVTGLTAALTLASGQALKATGTATTGTITTSATKGLTTASNSPLQFTAFNGTTAPLTISGAGSFTLASGNIVTVTVSNGGTPLAAGTYTLINKGASGSVAGAAPTSLTVNGDGIAAGTTASLQITGSQLVLNVVAAPTPTVTVAGGPLNFGNTVVGATSAEQTYTVAGSNLTADITVTAPSTDFQVSKTSGSGFGSSVTFTQSGGSVSNQIVYVRFTPQSTGAKSGNVTNASTGATTKNIAVSGTGVACPTSFTVNDAGDASDATPGDGVCATSGSVCTLRAALMEANAITACAPLTINFSVTGTINVTTNQLPAIDHPNLTISGPGASQLDVHRNDSLQFRLFTINSGKTVAISGLTISNGNAQPQDGGGIFNQGTLSLTDCVLSNNTSPFKGGGVASTGPLTVTRCAFTGNSASIGGGIAQTGSTLSVTDSTLNTNTASSGGGVSMRGGTHTLTNCTISGNTATSNGGGVEMFGNSSQPGTATLTNCTITGNTSASGAGVFTSSGDATVIETRLKNTLVASNTGNNFDTTFFGGATNTSLGNNLDSDGTSHFTNGLNGDIVGTIGSPINALLAALGNYGGTTNTHALLPGSPAINAGTSSGAPTTDQRGSARFGATDIGSFESQGFTLTISSGDNQSTTVNTAFGSPLSLTVAANNASEPVNGGQVTFMPPGSGASASIAGNPATISGGGATSGTVTANSVTGGYNVAASATGASSINFGLTNTCQTITVNNPGTNTGTANSAFTATFAQTGGIGATNFTTASTLPTGITLSTAGVLGGTPTQTGSFPITVKATDSNGCMGTSVGYTLTINCQTITVTNPATTTGTQFSAFSQTFTQTGGIGTTSFSTASALPNGLTLSSAGVLSGTPTQTGTFPIVVVATDSNNCMGTGTTYTLIINAVACVTSLTVNNTGDGADATPGNGVCETATGNGICTLRAAIQEANALPACTPFTINFSVTGTITLTNGQLLITHPNLTITGPGASQLTVSGNNASRIFEINIAATASISGLTITNGNGVGATASGDGGGIYSKGKLTLTGCVVTGNTTTGVTIHEGGGINNAGSQLLTLTNCTISNNTANFGGAGVISLANLVMTGCTVANNTNTYTSDSGRGGGIETYATTTITNSTISGNHIDNGTGDNAGGIWNCCGPLTIINSTITGNSAAGNSGAASAGGLLQDSCCGGSVTVLNSIIAGNTGTGGAVADVSGAFISNGYNLIGDGTGATGFTGAGDQVGTPATPINALLSSLGNFGGSTQTHALLPGSPAINAGTSTGAPTTDQRGKLRFGATDIGAFESQGFTLAATGGGGQSTTVNTNFPNPLTLTIAANNTADNEPVDGGRVTFTAPGSGASCTFASNPATISGSSASSGIITANGTAGSYNVTANATGAASSVSYALMNIPANTAPSFVTIATPSRTQGAGASNSTIATITDAETPAGSLTVAVTSASPANGVTVSNIQNSGGTITADIVADCTASNASFTLQVSDGSLTGTGVLNVTVTPATPPTPANAGMDQSLCGVVPATLAANAPSVGTGAWSVVSGPSLLATQFSSISNPAATFTPASGLGIYTLRWTITGVCGTSTDDVMLTFNAVPTITLGASPSVLQGTTTADLPYTATTGSPNQYSIDYDTTANTAGFVDVTNAALPSSPIVLMVPAAAPAGTYNATLAVRDSTTGCVSSSYSFTVTVTSCPTQFTVNDLGDASDANPGDMVCATSGGVCTLRAAIEESTALAQSCSPLTINFTVTGTINLATELPALEHPNLTIQGPGANLLDVHRNSADLFSVFTAFGDVVTINDLTISNGNTDVEGIGGGIYSESLLLTVNRCHINGNAASFGGGVGGDFGTVNINNSTISDNSANFFGGGVANFASEVHTTMTLTNCTISGNSVTDPGATDTAGGIDNSAEFGGTSTVSLINCTITGNSTANSANAGGIFSGVGDTDSTADIKLKNTVLAGNSNAQTLTNAGGTITSQGHNLVSDNGGGFFTGGGDLINTNPLLATLGNYGGSTPTHALLLGSPAINAGTSSGAPTTDQRGITRPQLSQFDMGAFESQGFTLAINGGNNQSAIVNTNFANPLSVTVTANDAGVPVNGGVVTFTPPGSGASAGVAGNPAIISGGLATSGTVTANSITGAYSVSANATGVTAAVNFSLTNTCQTITVTNPGTNTGTVGAMFTATFTQMGGIGATMFSTASTLPTGITLASNGVLSGTPTQTGSFPITVIATDSNGCMGSSVGYTLTINCQTITVNNAATNTGTANSAFTATFTQTGGIGTTTFTTASTLPAGITLSSAGVLGGTPTQTGSFPITVKATDSNGCMGTSVGYTLTISCQTITVNNPATNSGTANSAFSATFTQTGGIGTTTFTTASTLPAGITLSSAGVLSGTPTQTGSFPITVKATDSNGCMGTSVGYTLTINCQTITVNNPATNTGTANSAFTATFTQTGGIGTTTFSTASTLPAGITLSGGGVLSGTPTQTGSFPITVKATDSNGCMGTSVGYTLTINCQTITVNNPATNTGTANSAFTATFTQTGGIGTTTFTTASTLPAGITLSSGGVLSGTPTQTGSFPITVKATDSNGCMGTSVGYTLTINCQTITVNNPATNTGTTNSAFTATFTQTGGIGTTTFSTASTLPTGITLSSGGVLSGTPTQSGAFPITVKATDSNGCMGTSVGYTLTINQAPAFTSANTTTFTVNMAGSFTVTTSGFPTVTTITRSGALPTGVNFTDNGNGTATLSGTPAIGTNGNYPLIFTAANGIAPNATQNFTLVVNGLVCPSLLTVNNLGDASDANPGDGICATSGGVCTLRAAVEEANAITACSPLTINFSVTGVINLATALPNLNHPNLTIIGPGANQLDVHRNSASNFRIFAVNSGKTVGISGLTLSNGNVTGADGGGVFSSGNLTLTNCSLTGNQTDGEGGGVYSTLSGSLSVTGCTLSGNTANKGGGISSGSVVSLVINVTNTTISGNQAANGGGISIDDSTATVNLLNVTIANNTATASGGGIGRTAGTLNFKNMIIAGNSAPTGPDIAGTVNSQNFNLIGATSGATINGTTTNNITGVSALLAPLANNGGPTPTQALLPGSPAIDKGGSGVATDQRGQARPFDIPGIINVAGGNASDIGAFEVQCAAISLAGLPGGAVGAPYASGNIASGGTAPYTLSVTAGALPSGVTINGNGLTGTPTQLGTFNFTLLATDVYGCQNSQSYTVVIACPIITISPATLPNATINTAYPQTISASPALAYSFSVTSGLLPAGLTLNSNGSFSGAPTQSGVFNFRVTASLGACSGFQDYILQVNCPAITLAPASLPGGTIGTAYNQTVSASPAGSYFYSVTSGALPTGLTLNGATGAITGTPVSPGTFNFTITAAAGSCRGSNSYIVTIACPGVSFSPASLPAGTAGAPYSQALTVTPAGNYTFSLAQGNLPPGLTLNPTTGVISGLPSVVNVVSFIVKVQIPNSCASTQAYTLTINCPPAVTVAPASLPNGAVGTAYSQTLSATPAGGNYIFAASGTFPPGLSLNPSTGLLSGTPSANGSFTFTITATGFGTCAGSRTYTVVIGNGTCPTITLPASLPSGSAGQLYSNSVAASPTGSYSYTSSGTLPPGVTLFGSFGLLFGYPTANGTYAFTITATDASNCSASQNYTVVIGGAGLQLPTVNDFTGDHRSDFVLWRAANTQWLIVDSATNTPQTLQWGQAGDQAVSGDFDGDGKTDPAGFGKDGHWRIKLSGGGTMDKLWGLGSDVPVPGDYDGDGRTDLAIWRGAESGWYIQRSSDGQTQTVQWGTSLAPYLDVPVPGDYDGDGKTDVAVFRQASSMGGHWYIRRSSDGKTVDKAWGLGTDVAVPGDYDGDGKTDIAVWRGSEGAWYIVHSSDGAVETKLWGAAYAPYFDAPAVGDYDGDGKADVAVWRKSEGRWYVLQSSDGAVRVVTQGRSSDQPVTATPRQ